MKIWIPLLLIVLLVCSSSYAQDFGVKFVYGLTRRVVAEFHFYPTQSPVPANTLYLRSLSEDRLDAALMELRMQDMCTFDSIFRKYGLVFDTAIHGKPAERCAPTIFAP